MDANFRFVDPQSGIGWRSITIQEVDGGGEVLRQTTTTFLTDLGEVGMASAVSRALAVLMFPHLNAAFAPTKGPRHDERPTV